MIWLADEGGVGATAQVELGVVADIGAAHHNDGAVLAGHADHGAGGLTHAGEAHLAQEVEVILVERHNARPVLLQGCGELMLARGQHGVEERHLVACRAQVARRVERGQGRVGAHLLHLLGVEG